MNLKALVCAIVGVCSLSLCAQTQPDDSVKSARMAWFEDAKLGIFIHWGIYSTGRTSESWAFHNERISMADYMAQAEEFTASNYNPQEWVDLIKESGARYTVITTKHHDGFALWDTKAGDVSAVKSSPAKRDVLAPFADAVKNAGLMLGFYFLIEIAKFQLHTST